MEEKKVDDIENIESLNQAEEQILENTDEIAESIEPVETPVNEEQTDSPASEIPAKTPSESISENAEEKTAENPAETQKTSKDKKKKKKPFFIRLLLGIILVILFLLLALFAWCGFCCLDKTPSVKALPSGYSLYVRTDSVWEAVSPLVDLQAAEMILSEPSVAPFRELFFTIKESELRDNKLVQAALARRIEAALYDNNNFFAIADMGFLSGITRLAPVAMNYITVPGLVYVKAGKNSHFEYRQGETVYFIKVQKNLVLITGNEELLNKGMALNNDANYTKETIALLTEKSNEPFKIAADGKKLIEMISSENPYLKAISTNLSSTQLSTIDFGISDNDINLNIKIPYEIEEALKDHPVSKLLLKDSVMPSLLAKLPSNAQYYTLLSIGSLSELKDAAFSLLPPEKNIEKLINTAASTCPMLFGVTFDELLFDWTGNEFAVLGLEGKANPVFVIKIADEKKRQQVFDNALSSIILRSDDSLIMDGVRLPSIELPKFLTDILGAFDVSLPKPYYMVNNGFIYFSQSPENLVSINTSLKGNSKLSKNETWASVSTKQSQQSAISLFYNLERSIPFFLKGNTMVSKVLQLYNVGRADISLKKNTLCIQLQSVACNSTSTQNIAGYPLALEGRPAYSLVKSNAPKSKTVFWFEDGKNLISLNTSSLQKSAIEIENLSWITAADEKTAKDTDGVLWAVTKEGVIYLLTEKLEAIDKFPVLTGEIPSCEPVLYGNKLIFATKENELFEVTADANYQPLEILIDDEIRSKPSVKNKTLAFYEKGFLGGIHVIRDNIDTTSEGPLEVNGIAFGSPCISEIDKQEYIAFITQAGELTVWNKDNLVVEGFPVKLEGVFYLNVVAAGNYFFALSSTGRVFRVDLKGKTTIISIPYMTAKSGFLSVYDYNGDSKEELFVCGEGNTVYGFNSDLEMLDGFPLAGYGEPLFLDVNGDRKEDCLLLSLEENLNVWKIR